MFGLLHSIASLLLFVFLLGEKKLSAILHLFLALTCLSASPFSFLSPFFPYCFGRLM